MIKVNIDYFNLSILNAYDKDSYPFLLSSAIYLKNTSQYSILFTKPVAEIVLKNINDFDFLTKLNSKLEINNIDNELPFIGGYFVYLSYELIAQIEKKIKNIINKYPNIIAYAGKIDTAIIVNNATKETFIINEFDDNNKINKIIKDIYQAKQKKQKKQIIKANIINNDRYEFIKNIKKSKQYIKSGDIFQINLSRFWQINLVKNYSACDIYQKLCNKNPAPFSVLASFAGMDIISASPERLFKVANNTIQTRPIAGTRPRGVNDSYLKQELLSNNKERAEHIMLLDLERNDLGRICEYGSIHIDEFMIIESYPSVHHIVSNIVGELKENISFKNIITATFPGGTITGCPKVRCMEIITELETNTRGAYTGSIGYISNNNKMDFNILIRTFIKKDNILELRAGSGIVFDSNANNEANETEYKAQGMLEIFSNY